MADGEWYRFLAARPSLNEVNFWRPADGREFKVLTPGEPFFFKAHYPHNRLGGGFYSGFAQLTISEPWELFCEDNGVSSLAQMRARVGRYHRQPIGTGEDSVIGGAAQSGISSVNLVCSTVSGRASVLHSIRRRYASNG